MLTGPRRVVVATLLIAPMTAEAQTSRGATVETTNVAERSVLLSGQEGWLATIRLPRLTRDFARLRPGDRVETALGAGPAATGAGGGAASVTRSRMTAGELAASGPLGAMLGRGGGAEVVMTRLPAEPAAAAEGGGPPAR